MLTSALLMFALTKTMVAPTIEFRDFADGDTITKERTLRVVVQSTSQVRNVELYVGDELRDSDSSTPYEFKIDPLSEKDGDLKLTFAAYTADGESAKKSATLKIDSGTSKGAPFHVEAGNESLANQKWDDAIYSGRIALKASPEFAPARMLMARAYLGKGSYDRAQAFAEEVLSKDSGNADAKDLLAGINLRRAFSASGTDHDALLKTLSNALNQAVTLRRSNLDAQTESLTVPADDKALLKWADAQIRVGNTRKVVKELSKPFAKRQSDSALGNRIAYAQIREFDVSGAAYTLDRMQKEDVMDAYGYALAGVVAAMQDDNASTDKMIGEAESNDPSDLGLRMAKAYIALRRNRANTLTQIVSNLAGDLSSKPEVNYYVSILEMNNGNYASADRAFQTAVLAEPAFPDMFVERGNQTLQFVLSGRAQESEKKFQTDLGTAYFTAAINAQPGNAEALTSLALQYASTGKLTEALKYVDAANRANENYTAGFYAAQAIYTAASKAFTTQAVNLKRDAGSRASSSQLDQIAALEANAKEMSVRADKAKDRSVVLDKRNLFSRGVPTVQDAFNYASRYGRVPVLSAPK